MARRGEISLTEPAVKYLPAGTTFAPTWAPADHSCSISPPIHPGCPGWPANVVLTDFNNPGAEMTVDQLLKSVAAYELTRDVGAGYE